MVKKKQRILAVILLLVCMSIGLCACNGDKKEPVQFGIKIIPAEEEVPVTSTGFGSAMKDLFDGIVEEYTTADLKMVKQRVEDLSQKADELIVATGIGEKDYVALRDKVKDNKDRYTAGANALLSGEDLTEENAADVNALRSFLISFCATLGKENASSFAYDLLKHNLYLVKEQYSKPGSGYSQKSIRIAQEDYDNFQTISKKDFESVFSLLMVSIDLLSLDVESSGFTLTNGELAALIKKVDLSTDITAAGWRVVIRQFLSKTSKDSYVRKLYDEMSDITERTRNPHDDLGELAGIMPDINRLITSVQGKLTAEIIGLAETDEYACAEKILKQFSDEDWACLEKIEKIDLQGDYDGVAYKMFGTEYRDYANSVKKYTVADLKTCDSENLPEVLEGVLASISPAFSYRWAL